MTRDNSIYIRKNTIGVMSKMVLSRDLLGFYRMDVFEMVKNCWLYLGKIGIFVDWEMW